VQNSTVRNSAEDAKHFVVQAIFLITEDDVPDASEDACVHYYTQKHELENTRDKQTAAQFLQMSSDYRDLSG